MTFVLFHHPNKFIYNLSTPYMLITACVFSSGFDIFLWFNVFKILDYAERAIQSIPDWERSESLVS